MNAPRYTLPAIALHWLMALLMIAAFFVGLSLEDMPLGPEKLKIISYHKWAGITILGLALIRVVWRLTHRPPELPNTMPPVMKLIAHAGHGVLYVLMFAIPLTGWMMSSAKGYPVVYLGLLPLPDLVGPNEALADTLKEAHEAINWLFAFVLVGHVAAAIKHQLIDKDGIMDRMSLKPRR